jgi:allophanate hydrolase
MIGLRVLREGARSLVQDIGFANGRGLGIPRSGVLDRETMILLNGLLGNSPNTAMLEIAGTAPYLRAEGASIQFATGRGLSGTIMSNGHARRFEAWTTQTLAAGDEVQFNTPHRGGTALIGIAGGIDVPQILHSRATLLAARLGGIAGRKLMPDDFLPVGPISVLGFDQASLIAPAEDKGPLRVVLGAQTEWFTDAAIADFLSADWDVSLALDRMGMRLQGPMLSHDPSHGPDIVSDGIVPGAIQVPGNGQPIMLLADAQTTGGYPKIATVISADLSRATRAVPGDRLRFIAVSVEDAERAARYRSTQLQHAIDCTSKGRHAIEVALWQANLVSGMVDAQNPDHFAGALMHDTYNAA